MRVGRRKILLRNLILIFLASHFTRRMSFQIFIMNLNISSFFFMAKHSTLCVVVERCGKWRAKEIRNAFKRFFQHAISWSYRFFSSQFFFIQFFLMREWNSNFSSSTCDQSFVYILFPGTTLDTYCERHEILFISFFERTC